MKKIFEIEKPISELNILTIFIKYIVLGISLFFSSWILVYIFLKPKSLHQQKAILDFYIENPTDVAIIFAIAVPLYLIYRTWKKYKFGEVWKIEFMDMERKLKVNTINLFNNEEKECLYDYENLNFEINRISDSLFGEQRIINIYNTNKRVHIINIERTAWCRNNSIEKLIKIISKEYSNLI